METYLPTKRGQGGGRRTGRDVETPGGLHHGLCPAPTGEQPEGAEGVLWAEVRVAGGQRRLVLVELEEEVPLGAAKAASALERRVAGPPGRVERPREGAGLGALQLELTRSDGKISAKQPKAFATSEKINTAVSRFKKSQPTKPVVTPPS